MSSVTVIICTCNRPGMLKDALASVESQTSLQSVSKVIVSENGENRASEAICSEFKSLPIEYYYQQPVLPVLEHIKLVLAEVSSTYVAFLHDDDWWSAKHLELALSALNRSDCTSTFSNFVETASPQHPFTAPYKSFRVWALSGRDFSPSYVSLNRVNNFLNCLLDSSYHFSTFVGVTTGCVSAWEKIVLAKNSYDCDRTFPIYLGELGMVAYIPASTTFIRIHSRQDSARPDYQVNDTGWKLKANTTEWIATAYPELLTEARNMYYQEVLPQLSHEEFNDLFRPIGEAQKEALRDFCGLELPVPRHQPQPGLIPAQDQRPAKPLIARAAKKLYSLFVK